MNYLLIGCDQLRFDTLSINGNEICHTPNLDRLAREGINFTNAHSTAPLCTPARASMFTGNYALTHGMGTNCDMYHSLAAELAHPEALLHHKLAEKGYACGYIGKWHVGTELGPCDFGFEGMNVPGYGNCKVEQGYLDYLKEHHLSYALSHQIYLNPGEKTLAAGIWEGPDESTTDWYLTNRTIAQLEGYRASGTDYFATCQYWGPHGPHLMPAKWVGKADREQILPWASYREDLAQKPEFVRRHLDFYRASPQSWDGCREVIGLYYDYMMFIDSQIGRILEYLDTSGQRQNTTIVFTSDHGDMQWSHNGLIDKGFLYEEAMHIPLILSHPALPKGKSHAHLVSNLDILPTILDDAGLEAECDGQSLLGLLRGEAPAREDFLMEFHGIHFLYTQRAVLTNDGLKYIWTPGDMDELYDLNTDPAELDNLIDDERYSQHRLDLVERLKRQVVRYRDPVMDYVFKIFGQWESPSGQVDATSARYNKR